MEIRQATLDDTEVVHRIVQAAFEPFREVVPVSLSALDETIEEVREAVAEGRVLVAVEGEDGFGTVRYEVKPDSLYVGRLAVLPAYWGRGIGAALMAHIEQLAPSLGRTRIQLATRESVPSNVQFYERLGYTAVERVPHPRGPDITVWFEKELGEES